MSFCLVWQAGAFNVGDRVQCTTTILNIRSSPSTNAGILGQANTGDRGTVGGGPYSGSGYTWYYVSWDTHPAGYSIQDYLALVANQPPTHGIASQVRADTGAVMADPNGTVPYGVGVYFRVTPTDPDGDTARMEVELHQLPATFTGSPNYVSSYVSSGSVATTATATGLAAGNYGWRYRVVDSHGNAGAWVSENNPDFIVQATGGCLYSDDYPYPTGNVFNPANPSDLSTIDPWAFYNRECTSYCAWKLNKAARTTSSPYFFSNRMLGGHFGDAGGWATNATAIGFVTNNIPAVGAIAHWGYGELGVLGHVAYVEAVNGNGSVDVSEYNYHLDHNFDVRAVCNGVSVRPPRFIHIHDATGGGASPPVIGSPKLTGTTFTLSTPTEVGFSYVLEFKTALNDVTWTPVQTNNGSGRMIGLTNTGATGPRRMYRVRVQQP